MKKNKAGNKLSKGNSIILGILFIILIFLCVFLYFQLIDYFSILQKEEVYAKIIVGEKYGFDINNTALIFGMVHPGTGSEKEIFLSNNYDKRVMINIFVKGNIEKFIRVSENNFNLEKNETRKIKFFVNIPKDTEYGNYDGKVIIFIKNT